MQFPWEQGFCGERCKVTRCFTAEFHAGSRTATAGQRPVSVRHAQRPRARGAPVQLLLVT